jgi:hypothetical protein
MADVKNTKEAVKLVIDAYKVYKSASADGKIDLADLGLVIALVPALQPAIEGIGEVPTEIKDMDLNELSELSAYVVAQLGSVDSQATAIIEAALGLLSSAYKLYVAVKGPTPSVSA